MAKVSDKRITRVNAKSIALFEGTFAAILGLGIAILYSLRGTIQIADQSNSLLTGLVFGMTAGIVSILVLPFLYFAFGWIIGFFHGWVYNIVAESSGGIVVSVSDEK